MANFITKLKDKPTKYGRFFKAIKTGKYKLSIQASDTHYSIPRRRTNKEMYTHFELAIFNKNGWFNVHKSKVLREFPKFNELGFEHGNFPVAGYVPKELIQELYEYLTTK